MKKIIYSLVIMIAAGSLFTSCIEPVEPAGIYDLREAKARYYDALSKLRAADAALQEAYAALVNAQAQHELMNAEYQNKINEMQGLLNDAQAQQNLEAIARWEITYENLQKQHEIDLVNYEINLRTAKDNLEQTIRNLAIAALDLTPAERTALNNAITRYQNAINQVINAREAVRTAEQDLWICENGYYGIPSSATYASGWSDPGYIYDPYMGISQSIEYFFFEDAGEYYQYMIDEYTDWYEYMEELFEALVDSDLAEWYAQIELLNAAIDEAEYSKAEITKDSVLFMVGTWHDGAQQFADAVQAWMDENPVVANPGSKPSEPKESDYPASKYLADSIKFPVLPYKTGSQAFDKLRSMLSGYRAVNTLVGDSTNVVLVDDKTEETLTLVANQKNPTFKQFVLGEEKSVDLELKYYDKATKKDVIKTAKYGINGAIGILERDLVLKKGGSKTQEQLDKERDAALKQFKADRDTLLAIYTAQNAAAAGKEGEAIAKAYEPLALALKAYEEAVDKAKKDGDALVKASEKLVTTVNGMITHSDMSVADSSKLVEAFVEFAKAREEYLAYTPYQNGVKYDNKNLFYYAYATSPDVLVDSIAFDKLTLDLILEKKGYAYDAAGVEQAADPVKAYYNIANQLLGKPFADTIKFPAAKKIDDATILNDGTNYTAYYGNYYYDNSTDPATIKNADGTPYTPKAVTDAINRIAGAVKELNNLWARFWDDNTQISAVANGDGTVTIAKLPAKYNPAVYTLELFTEPYVVAVFDGTGLLWTENLGAILGSVDPNATLNDGTNFDGVPYVTGAAIFEGKLMQTTDFYKYLKARDAADNTDTSSDLEKIKKWRDEVVAAFAADEEKSKADAKAAYDGAVAGWETAVATWEKDKAAYDAYIEKLHAFVGKDSKGNWNVAGDLPKYTTIPAPAAGTYTSPVVEMTTTAFQTYEGAWIFSEDSEQYKLAEKYVPGYPEFLAKLRSTAEQNDETILHLTIVRDKLLEAYNKAFQAVYDDFEIDGYYADFPDPANVPYTEFKEFVDDLIEWISDEATYCYQMAAVFTKALSMWNAGLDADQIWIQVYKDYLAEAQEILKDAEVRLAEAERYYTAVLAQLGLSRDDFVDFGDLYNE